MLSSLAVLTFYFSLLIRCFELLTWLTTVLFLTARVSRQAEQSLPSDTEFFIRKVGHSSRRRGTFNLHFSAQLPEDFFFPLGGLAFLFWANSEVFGDFRLSNREKTGVFSTQSD